MNLFVDKVRMPEGRIIDRYHVLEFDKQAVAAVVQNANDDILMVKSYRYVMGSVEWEVPAGMIDEGESIFAAARREVLEETGYQTTGTRHLYTFNPENGMSNRVFHVAHCLAQGTPGDFYTITNGLRMKTSYGLRGACQWFSECDRFLAVCLKQSPTLIGFVSLSPSQENTATFDLGYVFNFDYHGCGFATEACRKLLEHAFESLGATRITTGTAQANEPSCRLLASLGFRKTGESKATFERDDRKEQVEFTALSFAINRKEYLLKKSILLKVVLV